ncbi:unnamed protein product [Urochloa humidicola]
MANNGPNDLNVLSDSDNDNQPGVIYQRWLFSDLLLILTTLVAERHRSGELMPIPDLYGAVLGDLCRLNPTVEDLARQVNALRAKFRKSLRDGGPANNDRDQMLFELSVVVWPDEE